MKWPIETIVASFLHLFKMMCSILTLACKHESPYSCASKCFLSHTSQETKLIMQKRIMNVMGSTGHPSWSVVKKALSYSQSSNVIQKYWLKLKNLPPSTLLSFFGCAYAKHCLHKFPCLNGTAHIRHQCRKIALSL